MGERARTRWTQVGLLSSLAAGWLLGFAIHGSSAAATGWGDVPSSLLLLGALLCAAAGAVAWFVAPSHRRLRIGALAGGLMVVSFVAGNLLVAILWVDPAHMVERGETWFSLLLESWLWVGIPLVAGVALGIGGWKATDMVAHPRG